MSTPSLLNIPYLYKAGTLYSQIPESGAGDFTVTRTTTVANRSTRINKDGFIETVLDNVPRLDYPVGGAVNGCPALLVEPSATNSALRSAELDNAVWTNALWGNWSNATAASSTTIAPDGSTNAEELTFTTNTSSRLQRITGIAASTTYTFSMYVMGKAGNSYQNGILLRISTGFNNALVTVAAATSRIDLTVSNTIWTRYSVTFTTPSSGVNEFNVGITVANSGTNPNATMICWGAQLEVGSVPTSYIPTTTAAVTRNTETIANTSATALIGQSEGTLYWDIAAIAGRLTGTGNPMFGVRDSATTNWVSFTSNTPSNPFRVTARITLGTVIIDYQANITSGKAALAWSSAGVVLYVNGISVATSATNPNFSFSVAEFVGQVVFKANAFELYPNRIPNTAAPGVLSLATLTAL